MREIKFRAWDKGNFEMFTYDNIGDVIFGLENDSTVSLFICDSEESPNVEIMQYTGLKDKNDKEIYEGDIIKRDKNCLYYDGVILEVVTFKDGAFGCSGPLGNLVASFNPEVIGNIYENPELLATKESDK